MKVIFDSYYSDVLGERADYTAILPEGAEALSDIPYIMITHGMTDDLQSWLRGTHITDYLEGTGFAAILPFAENSYYADMATGKRYFSQIAYEFPAAMEEKYRLDKSPGGAFIMGNSMGGYGALKLALSRPGKFTAAVSLSGVTDIVYRFCDCGFWREDGAADFGADYMTSLPGSRHDLYALVAEAERTGEKLPSIWQICGTEDYLYEDNARFRSFMSGRAGWDYKYSEDTGAHWWDFWDRMLPSVIGYFKEKL